MLGFVCAAAAAGSIATACSCVAGAGALAAGVALGASLVAAATPSFGRFRLGSDPDSTLDARFRLQQRGFNATSPKGTSRCEHKANGPSILMFAVHDALQNRHGDEAGRKARHVVHLGGDVTATALTASRWATPCQSDRVDAWANMRAGGRVYMLATQAAYLRVRAHVHRSRKNTTGRRQSQAYCDAGATPLMSLACRVTDGRESSGNGARGVSCWV